MIRLLLILITVIHLSGCTLFLETAAGTLAGNLAAEAIKEKRNKINQETK